LRPGFGLVLGSAVSDGAASGIDIVWKPYRHFTAPWNGVTMVRMEESPRQMRVASSRIDLSDVSGRVLFPSPVQGPWLPFLRFADSITTGGGDDPEGHTHVEEEVLNYIVQGRTEYEDNTGHRTILEPGMLELLTAREETRHKLMGLKDVAGTRWLSVVVRLPRDYGGPSHRFQVTRAPAPLDAGEVAAERFLVGPESPVESGAGLAVTDLEFRKEGQCNCPIGSERRAVVYVFDGSAAVGGQPLQTGDGELIENAAKISVRAHPGARVLLASVPRRLP
jgi:redox-sensitive bicupin YhaK (pirin superfamily)